MSKISGSLEDLVKDFGGRIRNPLIGSFILVWLYKHWLLVFQIFSFDTNTSDAKLNALKRYVEVHNGFFGMVLTPLLYSLISLIIFYSLGILAQVLKALFKKLDLWILSRFDKPRFVERTVYEKEKIYSRNLEDKIASSEQRNRDFDELEEKSTETIRRLQTNFNNLINDVDSNKNFKAEFSSSLLIWLGKKIGADVGELNSNAIRQNTYGLTNGSWNVVLSNSVKDRIGETVIFNFHDNKVSDIQGADVGRIDSYEFDMNSLLLKFIINSGDTQNVRNEYTLIKINDGEYMRYRRTDGKEYKVITMKRTG